MAHRIEAGLVGNGVTHNPEVLCSLLSGTFQPNNAGVVPAPARFAFPQLGGANAVELGRDGTYFHRGSDGGLVRVIRSIGLSTCTSVIYWTRAGDIFVYHANASYIAKSEFTDAINTLRTTAGEAWIVFAHLNDSDAGHRDTIADLVKWGANTNRIIEVTNLQMPNFGINTLGWLGY